MASRPPKFLSDLSQWGAELVVSCRRCGHSGSFDPQEMMRLFTQRGWPTDWDKAGSRFRCTHCRTKLAELSMRPKQMRML